MGESQVKKAHNVTVLQRSHASITGVYDVCSFQENEIVLKVDTGVMIITGEGLHVGKLLLEEGHLDIEGKLDGFHYEHPRMTGKLFRFRKAK